MGSCRTCDKSASIFFNWPYAQEKKDRDLAALASGLLLSRALKFGHLYQCHQCSLYWFLDEDSVMMHRVRPERNEALFAWADRDLVPTREAIGRFTDIGATGPDQYGNGKGEIKVPCAIETTAGKWIDRALVLIGKMPPIEYGRKSTLLGDAVASISPSRFALPLAVRLETLRADEIRMGFAPTRVQSGDGRSFVLNGTPSFLSHGTVVGKDISLCHQSSRLTGENLILNEEIDQITYVYYDWYAGCESLVSHGA
ncbi:MAG: hypothetical protein U1G08_16690 [Verrucomicrobiota bacterium]